jgi:hypothetical protein
VKLPRKEGRSLLWQKKRGRTIEKKHFRPLPERIKVLKFALLSWALLGPAFLAEMGAES